MKRVAKVLVYHLPMSQRLRLNILDDIALISPFCLLGFKFEITFKQFHVIRQFSSNIQQVISPTSVYVKIPLRKSSLHGSNHNEINIKLH